MRDETVYGIAQQLKNEINQIVNFVQSFQQSVRLDSTGKEIRLIALQKLLLKKGLITEAELTEEAGQVLQEMQKQAEEAAAKAAAPAIVPATAEQVVQVANAPTTDTAVQEAVAPVVPPPQV